MTAARLPSASTTPARLFQPAALNRKRQKISRTADSWTARRLYGCFAALSKLDCKHGSVKRFAKTTAKPLPVKAPDRCTLLSPTNSHQLPPRDPRHDIDVKYTCTLTHLWMYGSTAESCSDVAFLSCTYHLWCQDSKQKTAFSTQSHDLTWAGKNRCAPGVSPCRPTDANCTRGPAFTVCWSHVWCHGRRRMPGQAFKPMVLLRFY